MNVANTDTLAPTDAKANGREHDIAATVVVRADATDEIETAVDARITLEHALDVRQIVDQHKGLGCIGTDVEAQRRPRPVDLLNGAVGHVQRSAAVAHADAERTAGLLTNDVGIGPALLAEDLVENVGKPARTLAKKALGLAQNRALVVLLRRLA